MVFDYYFSISRANQQPHFYNYFRDQQPPYDIEIQLPRIIKAPTTFAAKALFRLERSSGSNDPDKLVIGFRVWDFQNAASIRTDIRNAYQDFLISLDQSGLGSSAIQLIKTRLAEIIPVTFAELLFYHYGLDPSKGYVDLQPGMRLRVDYQNYELVHPAQDQRLHGYAGSGTSYYQIASQRTVENGGGVQVNLSFDPFVAEMQNTVVETSVGDGNSVAGIIDLHKNAFRKPYLRLFYPNAYPGISSAGWFGTEKNVTLIGADTIANLKNVTEQQYLKNGTVNGEGQAIYFRGRTAVIPEIAITVNGQLEYVSLGTTVRQLLDRYLSVPVAMDGQNLGDLGMLDFQRLMHQGSNGLPVYRAVHFEHYQAYADGTDIYDIPLLKGDRIKIG